MKLETAPLSIAEAQGLRRWSGLDAFGPNTDRPFLALDLRDPGQDDQDALTAWVPSLPCPVIAITDDKSDLAKACDTVVSSVQALTPLMTTILASPIAAMTFVQTLRLIETLEADAALTVESLAYGALQNGPEFRRWLDRPNKTQVAAKEAGPPVIIDRRNQTLLLTLNRPGNHNSLSMEMRDALVEALDLARLDDDITSITLSGAGRCFSVGGDLSEFGLASDAATAHWVRSVRSPARSAMRCGPRLQVNVHGACIGAGVELAAFAQRVTATPNTFFQLPELKMGLLPGSGGCVSLSRRIGRHRTAYMGLTGRRISAPTALAWGLVDQIIDAA